jgi:hypothetical protein
VQFSARGARRDSPAGEVADRGFQPEDPAARFLRIAFDPGLGKPAIMPRGFSDLNGSARMLHLFVLSGIRSE